MGHSNYIAQVLLLAPLALTNAAAIKERQLCLRPAVPVTTCQIADLSTANWNAFDIDGHLLGFINQFGVSDNFPRFFVQQSRADGFAKFDCSSFDNPGGCVIPAGQSPATGTDCNFEGLEETVCANFNDPKAGFVAVNYVDFYNYLRNQYLAFDNVANDIRSSGFINNIVEGFKPEDNNIALGVFKFIGGILLEALPVGRAVRTVNQAVKVATRNVRDAAKDPLLLPDVIEIAGDIDENNQNRKDAEGLKIELNRQFDDIINKGKARLQRQLDIVFGPNQDSNANDPLSSFAFNAMKGGVFMDTIPSVDEFTSQIKDSVQVIILSEVISSFGYTLIIDDEEILLPEQACPGNGGVAIFGGRCALFRQSDSTDRNEVLDSKKPTDVTAMFPVVRQSFIEMLETAEACSGGGRTLQNDVDFQTFMREDVDEDFPSCVFDFRVIRDNE